MLQNNFPTAVVLTVYLHKLMQETISRDQTTFVTRNVNDPLNNGRGDVRLIVGNEIPVQSSSDLPGQSGEAFY